MDPTRKSWRRSQPHSWILQKKVRYADFLPTVDGRRSKAETRMMFLWPEGGEPMLVNNLVRMSQGWMMGVDFNKEKTWVGSSIALHQHVDAAETAPFRSKSETTTFLLNDRRAGDRRRTRLACACALGRISGGQG